MSDRKPPPPDARVIDLSAAREHIRVRDGARRTLTIDVDTVKLGVSPNGGLLLKWDALVGKKYGLGSTTAREMVQLLELIEGGKVVSPEACKEMLDHLKACDDREKMTRFLPAGTVVAHKTGSVNASKTDAGIIYTKSGPVVLCVLTDGNEDQRWVADNAAQVLIENDCQNQLDLLIESASKTAK